MFNVSALLLDDARKLAMPLTNGAINKTLRHKTHGSAATHLRCDGIVSDGVVTDCFWQ